MNPNGPSIFDLTPSEKLQLVEDLWDDLAATPEAVPIHDWHKEELARRQANLMKNPASGLTWEEVKRRLRSRLSLLSPNLIARFDAALLDLEPRFVDEPVSDDEVVAELRKWLDGRSEPLPS